MILFVHNTVMWYRQQLFKRLSEQYEVKFVFTHINICKDVYGVEISQEIAGLEGVNYKALKSYFGIAFGVLKEAMGKFDVLVGGSWDSLPEMIETIFYAIISKLRGIPFVLWREEWDWERKTFKEKIVVLLVKFIVRNCDAILVPGTRHKKYFVALGASPEKVFIMPNVSNIIADEMDYATKERLKEELNVGTKKVVLYVGRLVKQKGIKYLITAFAKLRNEGEDIVLIIEGRGECWGELELLVKNLNIEESVYFMGYVKNNRLGPYYLLCDVCVVPSITYGTADAYALVVNEAMYFGKPVIATDAVGAAFDMVKEGVNGFMVPEKDSDALQEAMMKILSDPELEQRMGEESKRIIEEGFRYEHMVKGFGKAIEYVTKGARK